MIRKPGEEKGKRHPDVDQDVREETLHDEEDMLEIDEIDEDGEGGEIPEVEEVGERGKHLPL